MKTFIAALITLTLSLVAVSASGAEGTVSMEEAATICAIDQKLCDGPLSSDMPDWARFKRGARGFLVEPSTENPSLDLAWARFKRGGGKGFAIQPKAPHGETTVAWARFKRGHRDF
jgi:hypothetical protein